MVYTIWYIPIAAWYIPSKSGYTMRQPSRCGALAWTVTARVLRQLPACRQRAVAAYMQQQQLSSELPACFLETFEAFCLLAE